MRRVPPHPGPLPLGEGETHSVFFVRGACWKSERGRTGPSPLGRGGRDVRKAVVSRYSPRWPCTGGARPSGPLTGVAPSPVRLSRPRLRMAVTQSGRDARAPSGSWWVKTSPEGRAPRTVDGGAHWQTPLESPNRRLGTGCANLISLTNGPAACRCSPQRPGLQPAQPVPPKLRFHDWQVSWASAIPEDVPVWCEMSVVC